jgi:hypothetical protein
LENALARCKVILAIIGPSWATVSDERGRRLDNPDDFVRREILFGIEKQIPIIPVLVSGASPIKRQDLPEVLLGFDRQQAFEIRSGRDFHHDAMALCGAIDKVTRMKGTDYRLIMRDVERTGLIRAVLHFSEDQSSLSEIEHAQELLVVMNDGRSWIDSNREALRRRAEDRDKSTAIILLHPKSEFIDTLIKKNGKSKSAQIEEIKRSYNAITGGAVSPVKVFGHHSFNPASLVMSENFAYWSPYFYMESGGLPMFKCSKKERGLYQALRKDFMDLLQNSQLLDASCF